jgi:hypothetical protein
MRKFSGYPNSLVRSYGWFRNDNRSIVEDFLYPENVSLAGAATTRITETSAFTVVVRLSGTATARIEARGNVYVGVYLSSVASTRITSTGNLSSVVSTDITAKATVRITATGNLFVEGFGARLARATLNDISEFWTFTVEPQQ